MTYRDELAAAQARADAAERENELLRGRLADVAEGRARGRKVPLPPRFHVDETADSLTVKWRWFHPGKHISLLLFCLFWDGFLVFWYSALAVGHDAGWIDVVFPIAHVAAGVVITYTTLAGFLNHTIIRVHGERLAVRSGPVPWRGNRVIARSELDQIYVTEVPGSERLNTPSTYRLDAMDRHGRRHTLVSGLDEAEQGRWLEVALERKLGIVDEPVSGELARAEAARP